MYLNTTHLTLRKNLGILGIGLPILLIVGNNFELKESISHFYYSRMIVVFTGILGAFGLFLFSYRGYDVTTEKVSDNILTNLAGLLAIITALVPTACYQLGCAELVPNGHSNSTIGTIHLIAAAGFLIIMGWMSYFRFTMGDKTDPVKKKRNRLYRICGIGLWGSLLLIAIGFVLDVNLTGIDVFIGETAALIFFGVAWLVKGEALKSIGL